MDKFAIANGLSAKLPCDITDIILLDIDVIYNYE